MRKGVKKESNNPLKNQPNNLLKKEPNNLLRIVWLHLFKGGFSDPSLLSVQHSS